ncbi:DUF4365 domain-containing protein [Candidatus Dojkabacteria bacterium]|nr:DUF4365 domain-containing protein [Candidatus Dojkabacteria bacterium]
MNTIEDLGKNRSTQHTIGELAVNIFRSILTTNEKEVIFTETPNQHDYGIDGQLQIFNATIKGKQHSGIYYHVQIKGEEVLKLNKDKSYIKYPLSLRDARSLLEITKMPTAFILVDTTSRECYWFDLQTNDMFKQNYQKSISKYLKAKKKVEDPSITISIPTANKLPSTWDELLSYFKNAATSLSKRENISSLKSMSLDKALLEIDDFEGTLDLPGMDKMYRNEQALPYPGTILSVSNCKGKVIDYVPGKNCDPSNIPSVNFKVKFKKDDQKIDIFQEVIKKGNGSITLEPENIEELVSKTGDRELFQIFEKSNVSLTISPVRSNIRQNIIHIGIPGKSDSLTLNVNTWRERNEIVIKSNSNIPQLVSIDARFDIVTKQGKMNFQVNTSEITSIKEEVEITNFYKQVTDCLDFYIDYKGIRKKAFNISVPKHLGISEKFIEVIEALSLIEEITKAFIPYPLPDRITVADSYNIIWIRDLISKGKANKSLTIDFTLESDPPTEVTEGNYVSFRASPAEFNIFGKPYVLSNYLLEIQGKIIKLEKNKGKKNSYKITIENAEHILKLSEEESNDTGNN